LRLQTGGRYGTHTEIAAASVRQVSSVGRRQFQHARADAAKDPRHPLRDLPPPTGQSPFQLDIADILPAKDLADIKVARKLTFHVNRDMSGINFAVPQQLVARGVEDDFVPNAKPSDTPAFLYISWVTAFASMERSTNTALSSSSPISTTKPRSGSQVDEDRPSAWLTSSYPN
jgi:hypothetical protein